MIVKLREMERGETRGGELCYEVCVCVCVRVRACYEVWMCVSLGELLNEVIG
jgi:hypothetical protein